jgi:hypothetical protein
MEQAANRLKPFASDIQSVLQTVSNRLLPQFETRCKPFETVCFHNLKHTANRLKPFAVIQQTVSNRLL